MQFTSDGTRSDASQGTKSVLKVLITARPDGDIIELMASAPRLDVSDRDTAKDVQALIEKRVDGLAKRRRLNCSSLSDRQPVSQTQCSRHVFTSCAHSR